MDKRIAVIADRLGWEEKRLLESAADYGLEMEWINDASLLLGASQTTALDPFGLTMVRSRSYTRGGLLATMAEASGIRTLNTSTAIQLCENKLLTRAELHRAGVPVPDFRLVLSRKDFNAAVEALPMPLVLKPVFGGMGKRVTLIRDADIAPSVYDYVEDLGHAFEQACLMEPYLGGDSIRCLVVGDEIVAAAEFESAGVDWRSNAALGNANRALPHREDVVDLVDQVIKVLGPGIYGVDLFATPAGLVVNEVNHAPGYRGVETATGTDVSAAICRYLKGVLQ
jgi:RimK family alpha-L-glutamate ligase